MIRKLACALTAVAVAAVTVASPVSANPVILTHIVPHAGMTVSPANYPGTDRLGAAQLVDGYLSRPMAVTAQKIYLPRGSEPKSPDADIRALAGAGAKLIISIKPPAPETKAGYAWVLAYMKSLKAAGIRADIILWQEPIHAGPFPVAADYVRYVRYYASAIRPYYDLVYNPNANPQTMSLVDAFYPGDSYIDKVEVDTYCPG